MNTDKNAPAGLHTGAGRGCCHVETAGTLNIAPGQVAHHAPEDAVAYLSLALLRRRLGLSEQQARAVAPLISGALR